MHTSQDEIDVVKGLTKKNEHMSIWTNLCFCRNKKLTKLVVGKLEIGSDLILVRNLQTEERKRFVLYFWLQDSSKFTE